jgi:hypothetical protein
MAAVLPSDVSVILTVDASLNVAELVVDSTEVVVVNATMPMILSFDPIKGDVGPPGAPSTVPGPQGQRGSVWFTGSGPPPTPLTGATVGDFYLDSATGNYYLLS